MTKIMIVFGTRPEAIKMAPLCKEFERAVDIQLTVCVTAQHREMLDQVLNTFGIIPDIDLDIMRCAGDLHEVTASMITEMRGVLATTSPDLVIVHGDTATTFATALASFYSGIDVAHVEAGLRTNDIRAPFPEEFNRRATSLVAKYHLAPTTMCFDQLVNEGIAYENILVSGNTVIDALYMALDKIDSSPSLLKNIQDSLNTYINFDYDIEKFVLITGHRRENLGQGLLEICTAVKELASKYKNLHFVYPMHLNPNVQKPVQNILDKLDNVWLTEPLAYDEFLYLMNKSYFVMTDSGGIQEEAPSLGKPVLVMRDVTERMEALKAGTVKLVGTKKEVIVNNVDELICNPDLYSKMSTAHNPYGDGMASERIVQYLLDCLRH